MSRVSWKEIEEALEDEKPIEEKPITWEEEGREYDEWMERKMEEEGKSLAKERCWDDDLMTDWLYNEWYDDDSDWDGE